MKIVHKAGRTYNDMKPQNVMISYENKEMINASELAVTIIDFGFVDKFKDEKNNFAHIERAEKVKMFQGNLLFASVDQMKFFRTSRKDDMIALF